MALGSRNSFCLLSRSRQSAALVGLAIIAGLQPVYLKAILGIASPGQGLLFIVLNLAVSIAGFRTGHLRSFWVIWTVLSLLGVIALGLSSPVGVLLLWPVLF